MGMTRKKTNGTDGDSDDLTLASSDTQPRGFLIVQIPLRLLLLVTILLLFLVGVHVSS
jgi:hypothetical protein